MNQTCILVLGMHRSGTSALAGTLSLLDIYLGSELMEATHANKKGYFENNIFYKINKDLLSQIGSSWDDVFYNESKLNNIRNIDEIKNALNKEFQNVNIFAVKDPRLIYLFPIYIKVLDELNVDIKIVLPYRNPLEVAISLNKRDGMPLEKGMLLWAYHFLLAEKFSRGYERVFVGFNELISDTGKVIDGISSILPIDLNDKYEKNKESINEFLDPNLKHHNISIENFSQNVPKIVKDILSLVEEINSTNLTKEFDKFRDEFFSYQKLFYNTHIINTFESIQCVKTSLRQKEQELSQAKTTLSQQEQELNQAKTTLSQQEQELNQAKTTLSQQEQELNQTKTSLSHKEQELSQAKTTLTQQEQELNQAKTTLSQQGQELNQTKTSLSHKEQKLIQIKGQLNHKSQVIILKEKFIQDMDYQISSLEGKLTKIYRSKSWKITRPLRMIRKKLRHFKIKQNLKYHELEKIIKKSGLKSALRRAKFKYKVLPAQKKLVKKSGLFDRDWYLAQNSDVVESGMNPLVHYIEHGAQEGRNPNPLFDTKWYLEQNPDVVESGMNPLVHYIEHGAREGRNPNPLFDTKWYLEQNSDIAESGINPLIHYIFFGQSEGRLMNRFMNRSEKEVQENELEYFDITTQDYAILRQDVASSGFWDENWYLSNYYNEYKESKYFSIQNPIYSILDYYLNEGWKRGHKPSENFVIGNICNDRVNPVTYFLNCLRFEGYQFEKNVWIPSESIVQKYIDDKKKRKSSKVVYTCIIDKYDELMQPYFLEKEWDYICFTDDEDAIAKKTIGVWEIKKIVYDKLDSSLNNRWHKIHAHILFPEYEESIYIDGNINITSSYLFKEIEKRNQEILFTQHFKRNCIYDEIKVLISGKRLSQKDKSLLLELEKYLKNEKFPRNYGLGENNIIYRKHNNEEIIQIMNDWWKILTQYAPRDQVSFAYVMWKYNRIMKDSMFINSRINYKNFWMVKHQEKKLPGKKLTPAFRNNNITAVFSTNDNFAIYLGVAIKSLIENITDSNNYDIIVLECDLKKESADKLKSLCDGRENVSLRFLNMKEYLSHLPYDLLYVDGYVPPETYNKFFLTEILNGYEKCLYLDSDIVILDDIAKLHNFPLKEKSIGASHNIANINAAYCNKIIKDQKFQDYLVNKLGVFDYNKYFQAGILVLDLKQLYNKSLLKRCISKLKEIEKPIFFDQCVFNSLFYNDVTFFSTAWNHVWYIQKYSYLKSSVTEELFYDYAHGRIEPKIMHYASKDKPQNKPEWAHGEYFWKYARMTPFFEEILEDCSKKISTNDYELLVSKANVKEVQKARLLVHLHLYYFDQLEYMLKKLQNINNCIFDLYVTVPDDNHSVRKQILDVFNNANIIKVENKGYDIYPFLFVLKKVRLDEYDYILKIHTKNSRKSGEDEVYSLKVPGYKWRDELVDALLGSEDVFNNNISLLQENSSIGCIGAKRFIFDIKNNNEERVYKLNKWKSKLNINKGSLYIGGSMFLARSYPFERIKNLNYTADDFGNGVMKTKDYKNLAHVFERLFGIIICNEGFEITGIDNPETLTN